MIILAVGIVTLAILLAKVCSKRLDNRLFTQF